MLSFISLRFPAGSHMYVLWYISDPTGENDDCKTAANTLSGDPPVELFVDTNDVPCDFPFRYKNVLYYGCTNITIETKNYKMCASKTDVDYNALQMSFCNDYCHCQCETFRFCYVEGWHLISSYFFNFSS